MRRGALSDTGIPVLPLAEIVAASKTGLPVLLKCDIEGSELQFVENYPGVLAKTRWVVMEMHHDLCDVPRCRQLLRDSGFTSHLVTSTYKNISVELFGRA